MHCFGCQDHAYILLSKDSTTYANVVPHMQSIRNKHKHSFTGDLIHDLDCFLA